MPAESALLATPSPSPVPLPGAHRAEGSLCRQVSASRPADLPGLLVVHARRPARGGGGLSLWPGLPACAACGGGGWGGARPPPTPSLYTCGQNSPRYLEVMSACHQRAADALVAGAISNGGLYVKLGQGLCSFNHLLPPEYIRTLRVLEDRALTRGIQEASPAPGTEAGRWGPGRGPLTTLRTRPCRWMSCSWKTSRPRPASSSGTSTTSPSRRQAWPRCTALDCMTARRWL